MKTPLTKMIGSLNMFPNIIISPPCWLRRREERRTPSEAKLKVDTITETTNSQDWSTSMSKAKVPMSSGTTATRAPNTAPAMALPQRTAKTDTGAINRRSKVCCPFSQGMTAEVTEEAAKKSTMAVKPGMRLEATNCLLTMKDRNMNTGVSTPTMSTGGLKWE